MMSTGSKYQGFRVDAPPELAEVVTHFYVVRNDSDEWITQRLIPSFQTIMVFNFGDPVRLLSEEDTEMQVDKCILLGPIKRSFVYSIPPNGKLLGVNFKDDAFHRFFGEVIFYADLPTDPDAFMTDNCFEAFWQQLADQPTIDKQIELFVQFCSPYLSERSELGGRLADFKDDSQHQIKAVAAEMDLSERTVQKKQKQLFGYSAKEHYRYQRFLKAIQYIHERPLATDWQDVVHAFNYYDQSHLIRDFQHFMGISPKQYLAFQQEICPGNG